MKVFTSVEQASECKDPSAKGSTNLKSMTLLGVCVRAVFTATVFFCAAFWAAVLIPVLTFVVIWLSVFGAPILVPLVALGVLKTSHARTPLHPFELPALSTIPQAKQAAARAAVAAVKPHLPSCEQDRRPLQGPHQPAPNTTTSGCTTPPSDLPHAISASRPQSIKPEAETSTVAATPDTGLAMEAAASLQWNFGVSCVQNERRYMEDRTVAVDLSHHDAFRANFQRAVLVAVFDGHGGADAAEYLAANISSKLLQEQAATFLQQPLKALESSLAKLEQGLLAAWTADKGPASGSTACVALLLDQTLHVAHVGDSCAVLARGPKAMALTTDHKPLCAAERQRIDLAHPLAVVSDDGYLYGELGVSRGLGSAHVKCDVKKAAYVATCDLSSVVLEATDDFVILATDGLWDKVGCNDATAAARRSLAADADPAAAAQVLADRAQKYGSTDNISVVVLVPHGRKICLPKSNSRLFSRRALSAAPPAGGEGSA